MKKSYLTKKNPNVLVAGLGYTAAEKAACSSDVKRGEEHERKRDEFNTRATAVNKQLTEFKNGAETKAYDNLMQDYKARSIEIKNLEALLEKSKIITQAWTANPELNYQTYLEIGEQAGLGFFKKIGKFIAKTTAQVTTLGNACNGAAKQTQQLANEASTAEGNFNRVNQEYTQLVQSVRNDMKYYETETAKQRQAITVLQTALKAEEDTRNNIMMTYEIQNQYEEMRLEAEARERALLAEAEQTGGSNGKSTNYLLYSGIALGAFLLFRNKKKPKKVTV